MTSLPVSAVSRLLLHQSHTFVVEHLVNGTLSAPIAAMMRMSPVSVRELCLMCARAGWLTCCSFFMMLTAIRRCHHLCFLCPFARFSFCPCCLPGKALLLHRGFTLSLEFIKCL